MLTDSKHLPGFIGDIPTIIAFLFGSAILILAGFTILSNINGAWQNTSSDQMSNLSKTTMLQMKNSFTMMDQLFLLIAIGSLIGLVVSALFIDTHPVFFVIFLILFLPSVFLSGVINDTMQTILASDLADGYSFPVMNMFFSGDNFVYFVIVAGLLFLIVLFGKRR